MRLVDIDLKPLRSARALAGYAASDLRQLLQAIEHEPDPADKFMQMFMVLQGLQRDAFALEMQRLALQHRKVFRLLAPQQPSLRLLAIVGPGTMEHNTPLDFLLYGRTVQLDYYYLTDARASWRDVPAHDVAFLAMGQSSANAPLHRAFRAQRPLWPRPVLNTSIGIERCARDTLYHLLKDIPGLHLPATRKVRRAQLRAASFPLLIRPLDTHGGPGLAKLTEPADLARYLQAHSDAVFYVSDFVDYASADGYYRKVRIALIDHQPLVCHLALSTHWLVNYASAAMHLSAEKTAEEQTFMDEFETRFLRQHGAALQHMARAIDLDYVVIDCAQSPDGRLLVFEADSGAWIHDTDATGALAYKAPHMAKAFDAFSAMLHRAANAA